MTYTENKCDLCIQYSMRAGAEKRNEDMYLHNSCAGSVAFVNVKNENPRCLMHRNRSMALMCPCHKSVVNHFIHHPIHAIYCCPLSFHQLIL